MVALSSPKSLLMIATPHIGGPVRGFIVTSAYDRTIPRALLVIRLAKMACHCCCSSRTKLTSFDTISRLRGVLKLYRILIEMHDNIV
jgi:hypothetical protein